MPTTTLDEFNARAKAGQISSLIQVLSLSVRSLVSKATETVWFSSANVGNHAWSEATQPLVALRMTSSPGSSVGSPVGSPGSSGEGLLATVSKLSGAGVHLVDFHAGAGTASRAQISVNGAVSAGATSLALDNMASTATILRGEFLTFENLPGFRAIALEDATASGGAIASLDIWPKVPTAGIADDALVTIDGSSGVQWLAGFTAVGTADLYYVGTAANGDILPWSAKGTVATGLVPVLAKPSVDFSVPRKGESPPVVSLELQPPGKDTLERGLRRRYTGFGMAHYCNGVNSRASVADPWDPEDEATDSWVTISRVFLPADPDNWPSSTNPGYLIDKNNWGQRRGTPAENVFKGYATTDTPATYTADSPPIQELEQYYHVLTAYNKAAETITTGWVKGFPAAASEISWGTPVATAGTLVAGTDALAIGCQYDLTNPFWGIIGWTMLLTGVHEDEDLIAHMLEPLEPGDGADDGVVAMWQSVSLDGTKLSDHGPSFDASASPTSPFEMAINDRSLTLDNAALVDAGGGQVTFPATAHAIPAGSRFLIGGSVAWDGSYFADSVAANTITATATYVAENFTGAETLRDITAAHNLEGGDALAGTLQPYALGAITNARSFPVAVSEDTDFPDFLIQDFGPSISVFGNVFAGGSPLTFQEEVQSLMDLFTTAVTAGSYVTYTLGGKVLLGQQADGAVTADGWGVAVPYRTGLDFDGSADEANAGTALNSLFKSDFTVEMWVYPSALQATNGLLTNIESSKGSLAIGEQHSPDGFDLIVGHSAGVTNGLTGSLAVLADLNRPHHLAFTCEWTGGTVIQKGYLNGFEVTSRTEVFTAPGADTTQTLYLGRDLSGFFLFDGKVSGLRIWSDVRTAAEIRDNFALSSPASEVGLVHHYGDSVDLDAGTWADLKGSDDITITSGSVVGAVGLASPHAVVQYGMDLAGATLDLSEADELPTDPVSLHVVDTTRSQGIDSGTGETLIEVMSRAIQGASGWLIFDPANSKWILRRFPDLSAATVDHTIILDRVRSRLGEPRVTEPPHFLAYGFRPVDMVQADLPTAASDARRALVREELRYRGKRVAGAVGAFPSAAERSDRPGYWRFAASAKTEAKRTAPLIKDGLDTIRVSLMYGVDLPTAGQVVEVWGDVRGGYRRFVLLGVERGGDLMTATSQVIG